MQNIHGSIINSAQCNSSQPLAEGISDLSNQQLDEVNSPKQGVLVFESNPYYETLLKQWLTEAGYKVWVYSHTYNVNEKLGKHQPDAILLSYNLEPINGIDTLREFKKIGLTVPVIAYSEQKSMGVKNTWFPLGLSAYVSKPSNKSILTRLLNTHIEIGSQFNMQKNKESKKGIE